LTLTRLGAACLLATLLLLTTAFSQPSTHWPVWSAPTAAGPEFHSKSLEGKVVVISVWASWCSSCRKQIPVLSQLQAAHPSSQLQVVSFSLDHSAEKHELFLAHLDVCFPAIFARTGPGLRAVKLLQKQAGALEAVPTLMVFDRYGRLIHRSVGSSSLAKLEELVDPLLASPSASSR
jgi:thiol-disulfide isomerase/thioredoxin